MRVIIPKIIRCLWGLAQIYDLLISETGVY
jgi:hypothetical protein